MESDQHPLNLPIWHYDIIKQRWTSQPSSAVRYRSSRQQNLLRVVTYNIWMVHKYQPLRSQHLFTILESSKAHIICLQEMKNPILQELISQPWVQSQYVLSDIDGRTFMNGPESYGVVMLIDKHLNLRQFLAFPFDTRQGRQLLMARIKIRTETFLIGTVHLESLRKNNAFRSKQLQNCQSIFNGYGMNRPNATCLLLGDFNFDAQWAENAIQMNILKGWTDLWLKLKGPHDLGLTGRDVRYDRIMARSSRVIPIKMRILGDIPIGQAPKRNIDFYDIIDIFASDTDYEYMTDIFPSDHYGLLADFDLRRI